MANERQRKYRETHRDEINQKAMERYYKKVGKKLSEVR